MTIEDELWKKVIALEGAVKGLKMEMVDVRNENKTLQQELEKLRADVASSTIQPKIQPTTQPTAAEPQDTAAPAQSITDNNGNTTEQAQTTPGLAVTGTLTYYMGNKAVIFPANSFDVHALVIVQIANSWFQEKMNAAFPNAGPTFAIQDDYTTTLISKELGFLNADNRFIIKINAKLTFSSPSSAPSLETVHKFIATSVNMMELARPTNTRLNPANPGNWFSIPFCNVTFHFRVDAKSSSSSSSASKTTKPELDATKPELDAQSVLADLRSQPLKELKLQCSRRNLRHETFLEKEDFVQAIWKDMQE